LGWCVAAAFLLVRYGRESNAPAVAQARAVARSHEGLARDLEGRRCVLDGEIVCLDSKGKPQFRDLLFRRTEPHF
jgi:hypothetical protein